MKLLKSLLTKILIVFLSVSALGQISKSVTVINPGTLGSLIPWEEKYTLKNLVVSGRIDARDIDLYGAIYPFLKP